MIKSISEESNKSPWSVTEVVVLPEWLWTKQEAQLWMSHEKMICSGKKMKTGTKEKRPQQK